MKDIYQRVREMAKQHNFTIITPKALPITNQNRNSETKVGPVIVDYLGTLNKNG